MRGYVLIFLLAAALLLLIPVVALPAATPTGGDTASALPAVTTTTAPPAATTTTAPSTEDDVFRILCDDEVVTLSRREFLIRTLAFEMPAVYHEEALKAQAVAAYTYYGRRRAAQQKQADPALKGADFATPAKPFPEGYTVDKLKETWGDSFDTYYTKICAAVDAVEGVTVTYQGELIDACYFALSNGSTESAAVVWGQDVAYLQAVASPGDCLAKDYQTAVTMTAEQVKAALLAARPQLLLGEDPAAWFGQPTLSEAGTVTAIPVGNDTFSGTALRQALSLRSATIAVTWADGQFTFTVKGYGHGLGMSQYGADFLARQGYSYKEILQYYYTDVTVT